MAVLDDPEEASEDRHSRADSVEVRAAFRLGI
jgi:hypothetical protein